MIAHGVEKAKSSVALNDLGNERTLLSIVVPVYNEQNAIEPFIQAMDEMAEKLLPSVVTEVIFINDGSSDATEISICRSTSRNMSVRIVNLSRNFGKEAALSAGLEHAEGDIIIPMDVDLQDDPDVIPLMISKWRQGAQVVNARRGDRQNDTWMKRTSAGAFYKVFNFLSDHPMPSNVGDFRLMDRQVVDVLRSLGENGRLNKALFSWVGFKTGEVVYRRQSRSDGNSTFSYWRLWKLALDGIFSSSTRPLRVWMYVGSSLALISMFYAVFTFTKVLVLGVDVPGYASTVILILAFGGLNLFALGVIGEYVGRVLVEVRGRPLFIVSSMHSINPADHEE